MKKLHSILAMLLIMVCSMNFASCNSDDKEEVSSNIIGKWAFMDDNAGFIFKENGELIFWESDWEDLEAYYRINGNKLICTYEEDGESCTDEFTIVKLNSTTLILGGYDEGEYEEMELTRVQ